MTVVPLAVAPVAVLPEPGDPVWQRLLDPAELVYCGGLRRAGEHLTARALARRVVAQSMIGSTAYREEPCPELWFWPHMALRRAPSGRPTVVPRGALDAWRQRHRLPVPGVSMAHAGGYAGALAWLPAGAR